MAQSNKVSMKVPEDVIRQAKEGAQTLADALRPFLIGLSVEDRKSLLKMGDKTIPFVGKVRDYCELSPEFAPNFLDVEEMKKDLSLAEQLSPIFKIVNSLHGDLDDTLMLSGSEAYTASLFYYNSVSYAAEKGNAKARTIKDDLAERYPGKKKAKKAE